MVQAQIAERDEHQSHALGILYIPGEPQRRGDAFLGVGEFALLAARRSQRVAGPHLRLAVSHLPREAEAPPEQDFRFRKLTRATSQLAEIQGGHGLHRKIADALGEFKGAYQVLLRQRVFPAQQIGKANVARHVGDPSGEAMLLVDLQRGLEA